MARPHAKPPTALGAPSSEDKERKGGASRARDVQRLLGGSWPLAALVLALPAAAVSAQELTVRDQVNVGVADSAAPELRASAEAQKAFRVEPSRRFDFADHVANGIAMRNRTAGTIHLRGAPVPSKVMEALLYVNFSDDMREGRPELPVLFNNTNVVAKKTADHDDPCWGMAGNHSYVADVTRLVPIGGHLNQDYQVVLQFGIETSTSGQNPWSAPEPNQKVRVEGATLVVVYRTQDTTGSVFVYDPPSGSMFSATAQFDLMHPALDGAARFTMAGADGQRGAGHDNSFSNELTFFNGDQIAGPPVASSDWDGSDGWPLVQLWDTHTHLVTLRGPVSQIQYQAGGDCLVPVAFVIDAD
jgi:hypothetical protein